MNIEKMNARTPPRPQGNVEGASTLTDATLLMGRGPQLHQGEMFPFLGLNHSVTVTL